MHRLTRSRPLASLARLLGRPQPPAPPPLAGAFAFSRRRLSNGMRLWVKPRTDTATVILLLQVPVGSRHETETNNGISHFLEHMLFTGTARWSEQEIVDVIRRIGGKVNARTSDEDTVYWLHLKSEDLQQGLTWLSEVVFRPLLTEDKFAKERQVIIQEKGGESGAFDAIGDWIEDHGLGWNVFRAVRHRLYPKSSLLLPVIGDDRSLRAITHSQLTGFYRQHYVPNNMSLIVVGDVDAANVQALAEKHLGSFPAGDLPPRPPTPPPTAGGFRLRLRGPSINDQGQILLGAPLPGLGHPDRWPLGFLAEILDTVLTRDIRYERGLVYGIDVYSAMETDVGRFVVYTTADSSKFAEIMAEVEDRIDQAIRGGFDDAVVNEARSAIRGRLLIALEDAAAFGWWLAEMSLCTPPGQPVPDLFAVIDAITPADVARVAREYLSPEKRYHAVHRPGLTPARMARPMLLGAGLAAAGLGAWLTTRRRARKGRPPGH